MSGRSRPLRRRWAILGPPGATVLVLVILVVVNAVNGSDQDGWVTPAMLTPGGPALLVWWHQVVRPRYRWWALGTAIVVAAAAFAGLYLVVLAHLPSGWDGATSLLVACWLAAFAYVAITRRTTAPFTRRTATDLFDATALSGPTGLGLGAPYEARFRFTRRDLFLVPFSALMLVTGILTLHDGLALPVPAIALGGGFLLIRLVSAVIGRVALRVDAAGVTLGVAWPRSASRTAVVPWSDIEAVILWSQSVRDTTVAWIGLQRHPGLPPLPGSARSKISRALNQAVIDHVPPEIVADSRPATLWTLHRPSLTAAVRQFAPTVHIVDLG